ncbi:MAG: hypothetical protein QXQ91_03120 [Nanopusillaceae archaeon]
MNTIPLIDIVYAMDGVVLTNNCMIIVESGYYKLKSNITGAMGEVGGFCIKILQVTQYLMEPDSLL